MTIVDQAKIVIEAKPRQLTAQQIGRLGELLVQYELLRHGIDSYACCQEPVINSRLDRRRNGHGADTVIPVITASS